MTHPKLLATALAIAAAAASPSVIGSPAMADAWAGARPRAPAGLLDARTQGCFVDDEGRFRCEPDGPSVLRPSRNPGFTAHPTGPMPSLGGTTGQGGGVEVASAEESPGGEVAATRLYGAPGDFPPEEYGAYGVVAWRTMPSASEMPTRMNVCRAFEQTFVPTGFSQTPKERQLVTVWPVEDMTVRDRIAFLDRVVADRETRCRLAIEHYGLEDADRALLDLQRGAPQLARTLDGRDGPFLIAWNPSRTKGRPDAAILVFDLSSVRTEESAKAYLSVWKHEIVDRRDEWADDEVSAGFMQRVETGLTNLGLSVIDVFLVGKTLTGSG